MHKPHHHPFCNTMVIVAALLAFGTGVVSTVAQSSFAAARPGVAISATSTPSAAIVLDATSSAHVSTFTLRAARENVTVDTLSFHNCVARTDADGDCADTGEVAGDDAAITLVTLSYTDSAGTLQTASGAMTSGWVTFTGLDVFLRKDRNTMIALTVDTSTIDDATVTSGMQFQFNLNAKTGRFHAIGMKSTIALTETEIAKNVVAKSMTLRNTEPTFTLSSSSPSGVAIPGYDEVFRFNATADAAGDVEWSGILLAVTATDNAGSDWNSCAELGTTGTYVLTNASTGNVINVDWTAYDSRGRDCSTSTNDVAYLYGVVQGTSAATTSETLTAGSTATYKLAVDTTWASSSMDDAFRISIPAQVTASRVGTGFDAIAWSDGTAYGTAIDGMYLNSLPLTGGTISY